MIALGSENMLSKVVWFELPNAYQLIDLVIIGK